MKTQLVGWTALCAVLLSGCGGGTSSESADAGTSDAEAAIASDAATAPDAALAPDAAIAPDAATPTTFSVGVYSGASVTAPPAAQVAVTMEQGGVQIAEGVTGADGLVTFPAPDWSLGPVAVSMVASGFAPRAMVGITPDTLAHYRATLSDRQRQQAGDAPFFLSEPAGGDFFATVSGALPALESGHYGVVTPTVIGTSYEGSAARYSLRVHKGQPFSLVAVDVLPKAAGPRSVAQDLFHFWQLDLPAIQGATTANLSAAAELTPEELSLDLEVTGGADGPLGGSSSGYFWVTSAESALGALFGAATACAPSEDAERFVCAGRFARPTGLASDPLVASSILLSDGGESRVVGPLPGAGGLVTGFRAPIPVTVSEQRLADPLPILWVPEGTAMVAWLLQGTAGGWQVVSIDLQATSLSAPAVPAAVAQALGSSISSRLVAYGPSDPALGYRTWLAISRSIPVK